MGTFKSAFLETLPGVHILERKCEVNRVYTDRISFLLSKGSLSKNCRLSSTRPKFTFLLQQVPSPDLNFHAL